MVIILNVTRINVEVKRSLDWIKENSTTIWYLSDKLKT